MHDEYNFKFQDPIKIEPSPPSLSDWVRFFTRVALIVLAVPAAIVFVAQVMR